MRTFYCQFILLVFTIRVEMSGQRQQVDISTLPLPQLNQLSQQLDQVTIIFPFFKSNFSDFKYLIMGLK